MNEDIQEPLVIVRRQLTDWRTAKFRPTDLKGVRWEKPAKNAKGLAAGQLLSAQVSCDDIVEGELVHTGSYGPCPHTMKVHIAKKENEAQVFNHLAEQAGERA